MQTIPVFSSGSQHEVAVPSAALPLSVEQPKTSTASAKCILIADDDTLVRGSLAAVLESEGYLVKEAQRHRSCRPRH